MASLAIELTSLLRHSAIYGLSNILGKAIGFLLIPLYTHYISTSDYGILELLDLSVSIIGMFLGLGISASVGKFYYDYNEVSHRKKVISVALILMLSLAIGMILIFWPLAPILASKILNKVSLDYYVRISLLTLALNSVLEIPLIYLRVQEQSVLYGFTSLGRLIMALSLNLFFIVYLKLGVLGILYSGLVTSTLFSIFLVFRTIRKVGIYFDIKLAIDMILFGFPLIFNSLGMFIINFGDRFILKNSASMNIVGIYSLGYKVGMGFIAYLIGQPFFLIWSVRRYSLIKENDGYKKYSMIFLIYVFILMLLWFFLCLFSKEIIFYLAPASYKDAALIMPLIALAYVFREISDFLRGAFMIKNKTHIIGILTIIATVYCIINYLLLIPAFKAIGAALATLSTFFFIMIVNLIFAMRILPLNYHIKKISIVVVLLSLIGISINILSPFNLSPYYFFLKSLILIFSYLFLFFVFLKKEDRLKVFSFLENVKDRFLLLIFDSW